jgi:hypothetical protein
MYMSMRCSAKYNLNGLFQLRAVFIGMFMAQEFVFFAFMLKNLQPSRLSFSCVALRDITRNFLCNKCGLESIELLERCAAIF